MVDLAPEHTCRYREENVALQLRVTEQEARLGHLEGQLEVLKRQLFGKKSEKRQPPYKAPQPPVDPAQTQQKRKDNAAARDSLPVETMPVAPVPPEKLPCKKCGGVHDKPLEDNTTELLVRVPEYFRRRVWPRQVLACKCGESVVEGPTPPTVYEGTRYDASVYADIVTSKCADSIPLYRLAKIYGRSGVNIDDSTLGDLFHRAARELAILAKRILERIAAEDIVLADETPVPVQAKGKTRRAYVWAFLGAMLIGFRFSPSRSGLTPKDVLGASTGTLVVDGYTGYNAVCTPDKRDRSGCLAHMRRKYVEARSSAPEAANAALDLILAVYRVEHEAKAAGVVRKAKHLELRQTKSRTAMNAFKAWADAEQANHLPQSPMGKAISYTLNQWPHMMAFLDNAQIPVDNNASERALRTFALGRKNWLFAGSDVAGDHLATLMTLVRSCEANGINPRDYLADVLLRIQTHPAARIDELLPDAWRPAGELALVAADSG